MTTLSQVVTRTRQKLNVGRRDTLNKLNGALTANATSIILEYDIAGVSAGARLSIDLEDFHVWDAVAATKTCTVQPALDGSTAATHADDSLVIVNPTYSTFEIVSAVNEVLSLLPGWGVTQYKTVDLTADASKIGYDLTSVADLLEVHRVSYKALGSSADWPIIERQLWSVQQKASTTDFASAEALMIRGGVDPGRTIRVLYTAPFVSLAALADDVEAVSFLPASAHALLSIGAAYRLTLGRPVARSSMNAQGDTRRPDEVGTNDARSATSGLFAEWLLVVRAAAQDQIRRYGL